MPLPTTSSVLSCNMPPPFTMCPSSGSASRVLSDTLRQWVDTLNAVHDKPREQARLFNQLLQILAEDTVPYRPDRTELRVRKR